MATKDSSYIFKDKNKVISYNQFGNLILYQNYDRVPLEHVPLQKNDTLNQKHRGIDEQNDLKTNDVSWRTKMAWNSTVLDTVLGRKSNDKMKVFDKQSTFHSSTLSLHITAYENSNETTSSDSSTKFRVLSSMETYPFEFPRQQNNEDRGRPDIMEFLASQQLLNPNQQNAASRRRISMDDRLTIHHSTDSYRNIAAQTGHSTSGVWYAKRRSSALSSLKNRPKRITVPEDKELLKFLDEAVDEEHLFIHRKEIAAQLRLHGYNLTPKQISKLAAYDGLYVARSVYQQMISPQNIDLRLFYRQYVMATRNFFYKHIFVDEAKILTGHNGNTEWYRLNERNKKHPRVAHRSGFTLFGGISRRGPTPFIIVPGNVRIDSEFYCNMIGHCIYPFMKDKYNMDCTLIQDNASIHVSKYTKDFLDQLGIRRSFFPPQSPDFTGIEYVWRNGKQFTSQKNPANLDELKLCIAEYVRNELTVEMCNTLIDRSITNILRSVDGMNHEGVRPTDLLYRDTH